MNIFPQDPKIDIGKDGFDGKDQHGRAFDLLGRKEFGQRLTNLVDRIEQPIVIALDGEWGSGKSHFLKLWTGAHKHELNGKAELIYFDAFEHDFLDDPLVSLISRLADEAAPKTWGEAAIATLRRSAFPLVKMLSRAGLAVVTHGATAIAEPVGDVAIAKISETTEAAIDQFWKNETNRIKAMQGFRDALTALTKQEDGTTQKIVFIIDELDRCRPDYALNLLEIIKHFFAVPNVHFVLGVNLRELENSVKARYGTGINARKYLYKFVMLEMRLPQNRIMHDPAWTIAEHYFQQTKAQYGFASQRREDIENQLKILRSHEPISIRDLQRVLTLVSLFPEYIEQRHNISESICISFAFLAVIAPNIFKDLRRGRADFEAVVDVLGIRKGEEHWGNHMWHALGIFFKSDQELMAQGAEMHMVTGFRTSLRTGFTPLGTDFIGLLLKDYFETFTVSTA